MENKVIFGLFVALLISGVFAADLGAVKELTNEDYAVLSPARIGNYAYAVRDREGGVIEIDTIKNKIDLESNTFLDCNDGFTCELKVEIDPQSNELKLERDFIRGLADIDGITFDAPFIRETINTTTTYNLTFINERGENETEYFNVSKITFRENTDITSIKKPTEIILRAHRRNALMRVDLGFSIFEQERWDAAYWNTSGGVMTYDGNYTIVTFTSSGTLNITGEINATVLVVGGGGDGGAASPTAGAGGAGGLIYATSVNLTLLNNTAVIVGAANGNSSLGNIIAIGGGAGGGNGGAGANGGSGGGAGHCNPPGCAGGTATAGQGNNGGAGSATYTTIERAAGGGGGANAAGGDATIIGGYGVGGNGGAGKSYSISGTSVQYACGGGGGSYSGTNGTAGCSTGGDAYMPATNGTGSGGGSMSFGGTGIVIIRYLTTNESAPVAGSLTVNSTSGGIAFGNNTTFFPPSNLTINATANNGYDFVNWTTNCNGTLANSSATTTYITINDATPCFAQANFISPISTSIFAVTNVTKHSFTYNTTITDTNGLANQSYVLSISAGTCYTISNSSNSTTITLMRNCTVISPATAIITTNATDVGGANSVTTTSNTYPDALPTLTQPTINSPLSNVSTATCTFGTFNDIDGDYENTGARTYEWMKDGVLIAGATSSTLNLVTANLTYGNSVSCRTNTTAQVWTTSTASNTSSNITLSALIACGGSSNITSINYTFADASTFASINASAVLSTFQFGLLSLNISLPTNTSQTICIIPNNSAVSSSISETFAATGYYSIIGIRPTANYSSNVTNIKIYMVNSSSSAKQTIITVIDNNIQPIPGVFVKIEQQNTTSGQFYQILIGETDLNGITTQILTPNTVFYRFSVLDGNNTVLATYQPQLVACGISDTVCYVSLTVGQITALPYASTFDFTNASCGWSNATGNLNCTPSGVSPATTLLSVTLINASAYNSSICAQTGVGNATVTCILPVTPGNCYNFAFGATLTGGETLQLAGGQVCITSPAAFVDRNSIGLILTFVLVAVLSIIGLAFGASGVFIGASFGLLIAISIGFLTGITFYGGIMGVLFCWILAWAIR